MLDTITQKPANQTDAKILIVDDEPHICNIISRWLKIDGYACQTANSADEAIALLADEHFSLMISDIMMPHKSGIELLEETRDQYPDMAVLMATAVDERGTAIKALDLGAYGYMIKPVEQNEFLINVASALERRRLFLKSKKYEDNLKQEVLERTRDIRKREEEIALRLVWASEYRDDDTGQHIRRIGLFSEAVAKGLHLSPTEVDDIRVTAPMHDIGKIGISDTILLKPGRLTEEEFNKVKEHTTIGAKILSGTDIPLLHLAGQIALSHHEKWDGSGYPHGLVGDTIPIAARITALVDVYDALVYDRVYRPAFPEEKALGILKEGKGLHFDPDVYDCFMDNLTLIKQIRQELDPTTA